MISTQRPPKEMREDVAGLTPHEAIHYLNLSERHAQWFRNRGYWTNTMPGRAEVTMIGRGGECTDPDCFCHEEEAQRR